MNFKEKFPPDELAELVKFIESYGHGAEVVSVTPNRLTFRPPVGPEQVITYTGLSYAYGPWGRSPEWQQALSDTGFSVPGYSRTPSARSNDRRFNRNH